VLREKLFTPGELLRQNQLTPSAESFEEVQDDRQLKLFDFAE